MKISVDKTLQTISADVPVIIAAPDQLLDVDLRDLSSIMGASLLSGDQVIVTGKAANNLAPGAQLFQIIFTDANWHPSAGVLRQFVNYYTGTVSPPTGMYAFLQSVLPAVQGALLLDVQYVPASGQQSKIGNLAVTVQAQVSSVDDTTPTPLPDAYSRFVAADAAQTLSSGQQAQARSNIGLGTSSVLDVPASGNASTAQVVKGNDARLSDARTPTAHAATHASGGSDPVTVAESQVTGLTSDLAAKEVTANKSTSVTTDGASDTKYPSVKSVKTYTDGLVVGLLNDRGSYDASGNAFPSTGGSGAAGAINKGDLWYISVAGSLGGVAVSVGSSVRALTNTPGSTAANWDILNVGIGFVPENVANKSTDATMAANSDVLYPSQQAVKTAIAAAIASVGAGILRSSAVLSGYTNSPAAPTSASIIFALPSSNNLVSATSSYTVVVDGGSPVTYEFADSDPADENTYVGPQSGSIIADAATLASAISSQPGATASSDGSGNVTITSNSTGGASTVSVTGTVTASDTGTAEVDPNDIATATLLAAIAGKTITPINLIFWASGITGWSGLVSIAFSGGRALINFPIASVSDGWFTVPPGSATGIDPDVWRLGDTGTGDLVASFIPTTDIPTNMPGGSFTIVGSFTQQ